MARKKEEYTFEDLEEMSLLNDGEAYNMLLDLRKRSLSPKRREEQAKKFKKDTGMTIEQIARIGGVSERTVFNNLAYARAWLHREIDRDS